MSNPSIPDHLMPDANDFEKMNENLTKMMPKEMAGAVNLLAHPVAGAAAMSALGVGLVSHAFGIWSGALSGAIEVSQRLFNPVLDDLPGSAERAAPAHAVSMKRARAAIETLTAGAGAVVGGNADTTVAGGAQETGKAAVPLTPSSLVQAAPAGLMPEDFRQPATIDKPAAPDDLKAISGIGPKLETVLNGLGIWTYGQIAGWTIEEIAWVDDYLGFKGRIGRDDWIGQAAKLAGGKG